jgi:nucleoside-diphosphate-sugar epimerase
MRVLVTGAAGFVGSQVVRRLVTDGHEAIGVDRSPPADHFPSSAIALDLEDSERVRGLLHDIRPEGLIHLAWYANPLDYLTSRANLASLAMTISVVEAALSAGTKKVVAGGSCVEYAETNRPLVEDDPVDPRTLYAACKHAAHQVIRVMARETGADLAWARLFHVHGPGENPSRLIPWVARQLNSGAVVPLTDGTQIRDHLHVADVAAALVMMLTGDARGIYNVCSGQPVTLRHVLETVSDIVGRPDQLRFGALPHRANETRFLAGDPGRLVALGWSPCFGLRDGLADALASSF